MVKSCLEHISKLILIGKSLANYLYMYVFYVCIQYMYSMYVSYVCVLCMYFMYVFYLCILCMYSTYAFRIFVCKASWLSRPPGAKIHEKQQMRIQEGHFLKIALNLDLTLSDDGECPALLISCGIIDLGAFCVELWSFFVSNCLLFGKWADLWTLDLLKH